MALHSQSSRLITSLVLKLLVDRLVDVHVSTSNLATRVSALICHPHFDFTAWDTWWDNPVLGVVCNAISKVSLIRLVCILEVVRGQICNWTDPT